MRPPLRVEAKLAEELRNWLTSELERLDASNTNPFAHHVVTILLQEDLDIEDEPLSIDDHCNLWASINKSARPSKTRDKQVKAAVHFLRSALACEDSVVESEIETIVNELVLRIDTSKQRLKQRRKSRGRDLLGALTVNTERQTQNEVRTNGGQGERTYHEVFPSLPGEVTSAKSGSSVPVSPDSVWNRSPPGKENGHLQDRARRLPAHTSSAARRVRFADRDEARACSTAAHVFALTLPDSSLPKPEAMEVPSFEYSFSPYTPPPSCFGDSGWFDSCWRSAFLPMSLTSKLYIPTKGKVGSPRDDKPNPVVPFHLRVPVVVRGGELWQSCDDLTVEEERKFLPVDSFGGGASKPPQPDLYLSKKVDQDDLEIIQIFSMASAPRRTYSRTARRQYPAPEKQQDDEIQGALSFPTHTGIYWNDMASIGALSMYPHVEEVGAAARSSNHSQPESPGSGDANLLGAVGDGFVAGESDDDEEGDRSTSGEWDGVTFTSDLVSFAVEKMTDLALSDDDRKGACAQPKGDEDPGRMMAHNGDGVRMLEDARINGRHPQEHPAGSRKSPGSLVAVMAPRNMMASSDSGILLHAAAERGSSSLFSDPPLSAPASLRFPPSAWPLSEPAQAPDDPGTDSDKHSPRKEAGDNDLHRELPTSDTCNTQRAYSWFAPRTKFVGGCHGLGYLDDFNLDEILDSDADIRELVGQETVDRLATLWDSIRSSVFAATSSTQNSKLVVSSSSSPPPPSSSSPTLTAAANPSSPWRPLSSLAQVPLPTSSDLMAAFASPPPLGFASGGGWPSTPSDPTLPVSPSSANYFPPPTQMMSQSSTSYFPPPPTQTTSESAPSYFPPPTETTSRPLTNYFSPATQAMSQSSTSHFPPTQPTSQASTSYFPPAAQAMSQSLPNYYPDAQAESAPSYFPPSSGYQPSELSQGAGMLQVVSCVLERSYVNSLFPTVSPESALDDTELSGAINCDDFERACFMSEERHSQLQGSGDGASEADILVEGRTCSKWLEGNCELGSACLYSHPSL